MPMSEVERIKHEARLEVFRQIHRLTYETQTTQDLVFKIGELYGMELLNVPANKS